VDHRTVIPLGSHQHPPLQPRSLFLGQPSPGSNRKAELIPYCPLIPCGSPFARLFRFRGWFFFPRGSGIVLYGPFSSFPISPPRECGPPPICRFCIFQKEGFALRPTPDSLSARLFPHDGTQGGCAFFRYPFRKETSRLQSIPLSFPPRPPLFSPLAEWTT